MWFTLEHEGNAVTQLATWKEGSSVSCDRDVPCEIFRFRLHVKPSQYEIDTWWIRGQRVNPQLKDCELLKEIFGFIKEAEFLMCLNL